MRKKMFYVSFLIFLIFPCCLFSQSILDSLTGRLEIVNAEPQTISRDTSKLFVLVALSEECEMPQILKYALPAAELSDSLLAKFPSGRIRDILLTQKAHAINNIGFFYMNLGSNSKALNYYNQSLKLNEELSKSTDKKTARDGKYGVAYSLHNMAYVYDTYGDIPKALEYYQRSLKIKEEIGEKRSIAISLNNIGHIYQFQDDALQALNYFNKSLKLYEELSSSSDAEAVAAGNYGIGLCLNNIGAIYKNKGDASSDVPEKMGYYRKAHDFFYRSLDIRKKIKDNDGIADALGNLGSISLQQSALPAYYSKREENLTKAMDYFQKSLEIFKQINNKYSIAGCLANISSVYLRREQYNDALNYAQLSLSMSKELGTPDKILEAEKILSRIYAEKKDFEPAYEHYRQFILYRDSVSNAETKKMAVRKNFEIEFQKKETAIKLKQEKERALASAESKKQKIIIGSVSAGLLITLTLAFFIYRGYRNKLRTNVKLQAQKQLIETQRNNILDSINYAKRIQDSVLMSEEEIAAMIPFESCLFFEPKDIVSGDFYWFASLNEPKGKKYIIVAADCTGHGVPGAFLSMIGTRLLDEIVNRKNITQPASILQNLHSNLFHVLHHNVQHSDKQDGMDVAICTIDVKKNILQYAGAMNAVYVVSPAPEGEAQLQILKADSYSIGSDKYGVAASPVFTNHEIAISSGTSIYLFSDGYMDQFGGSPRIRFGSKRFKELLSRSAHFPMKKQKEILSETIVQWKGQYKQIDDILVLGIKV